MKFIRMNHMTPEGKTKAKIKKMLNSLGVYSYMPVSNGMGAPSLDYLCCSSGRFFAIEAKAWDSNLGMTARQKITAKSILQSGGPVFLVRSDATLEVVREWITDGALALQETLET